MGTMAFSCKKGEAITYFRSIPCYYDILLGLFFPKTLLFIFIFVFVEYTLFISIIRCRFQNETFCHVFVVIHLWVK